MDEKELNELLEWVKQFRLSYRPCAFEWHLGCCKCPHVFCPHNPARMQDTWWPYDGPVVTYASGTTTKDPIKDTCQWVRWDGGIEEPIHKPHVQLQKMDMTGWEDFNHAKKG